MRTSLLLIVSLFAYFLLLGERITEFPPYFFCDEAIHGLEAQSILNTGKDKQGIPMPLYFYGLGEYQWSLSVYAQVPFVFLFGLNEFAVRMTTLCFSLLGVISAYFLVSRIGKRGAWITPMLFAVTPIWFLHARTGFEVILAVSFYLAFLACYSKGFSDRPALVIVASLIACCAFYSYAPARGWIALTIFFLLVINARIHFRQWKASLAFIAALLLPLLPYLYFHWTTPELAIKRLHTMGFRELGEIIDWQRSSIVIENYLRVIDPRFWFTWSDTLHFGFHQRHVIPGLSPLPTWLFPFALLGLVVLILNLRSLHSRCLICGFLLTPFPAVLVEYNSVRCLPVGVFYLIYSIIGLAFLLEKFTPRYRLLWVGDLVIAVCISFYGWWFREYVHNKALFEYQNYGFNGAQTGSRDVFDWVEEHAEQFEEFYLSNKLFNTAQVLAEFHLPKKINSKVKMKDLAWICILDSAWSEKGLWILPSDWSLGEDQIDCPIKGESIAVFNDPKGAPLIEMIRFRKMTGFQNWREDREKERRQLKTQIVNLEDETIKVEHTEIDIGSVNRLFDGNSYSIARSAGINPFRLKLSFAPRKLRKISVFYSNNKHVEVTLDTVGSGKPQSWGSKQSNRTEELGVVTFTHDQAIDEATSIHLTIRSLSRGKFDHLHVNEIKWE